VYIDDRLPLGDKGGILNSRMSVNKAWWLPILEKAYAKMNVNYSTLNGGNPSQALRELTGMPVEMFDSSK
jgi:calpain-15